MRLGIALGRGVMDDGSSTPGTDANALMAAQLMKKKVIDCLIVTGRCSYHQKGRPKRTEAQNMATLLACEGVVVGYPYVLLEEQATDTVGNFLYTEEKMRRFEGITEIYIICLPYTGLRAKYAAKMVFADKFKLKVVKSQYHPSTKEAFRLLRTELINYIAMRIIWIGVKPNDRVKMMQRLRHFHPAFKIK